MKCCSKTRDASAAISPLYWINRGAKEEIRATKSAGCCAERHYQVLTVNTGRLQCGILQYAPHHLQFTVNPVKWQQRNKCLLKQTGVGSRCLLVYVENQSALRYLCMITLQALTLMLDCLVADQPITLRC